MNHFHSSDKNDLVAKNWTRSRNNQDYHYHHPLRRNDLQPLHHFYHFLLFTLINSIRTQFENTTPFQEEKLNCFLTQKRWKISCDASEHFRLNNDLLIGAKPKRKYKFHSNSNLNSYD